MDDKANMLGGYFTPHGFFRIETGGSHEENPNGGVQVGVDSQGIPNVLEEGEPVYDDYVYSDNIVAEAPILEQFHIPTKYAGKLYSEIADAFADEAEIRPLDPVSNNGLRVMLGRLAEAQEQQKENKKQAELEEELANMTPEQLAELEALLANEEQMDATKEPMIMSEGGDIDKRINEAREKRSESSTGSLSKASAQNEYARAVRGLAWRKFVNNVIYMGDKGYERENAALETMLKRYANGDSSVIPQNEEDAIRRQSEYVEKLKEGKDKRQKKLNEAQQRVNNARLAIGYFNIPTEPVVVQDTLSAPTQQPITSMQTAPATAPASNQISLDDIAWYKCGGKMNKFDGKDKSKMDTVKSKAVSSVGSVDVGNMPGMAKADNKYGFVLSSPSVLNPSYQSEKTKLSNAATERMNGRALGNQGSYETLPTWQRYADPVAHGLLALTNALTPPTKFTFRRATPYYPTTRIALQDMEYNPIDLGLLGNQVVAQSAGTVSGLRNSGLGPMLGEALIAADANYGKNIGTTFLQGWNGNLQHKNDVYAFNSGNEDRRAAFNYQVDAARANALDNAQRLNIQNDLLAQRLNDAAESDQYAAISNELSAALNGLSGIGDENLAYNMANSVYPYKARKNGTIRYVPNSAACGGLLLKKIK